MNSLQSVTVLGATGCIGVNTLDVIEQHPERYRVFALTANHRADQLAKQCLLFNPVYAVLADAHEAERLQSLLQAKGCTTEVLSGNEGLCFVAAHERVDVVMAAIVCAAGLEPTLSAVKAGKKVLLANKEALVMAGALFMQAVQQYGATLLPIDSEHNAIFQCLPEGRVDRKTVKKIVLTGSGGPFRQWTPAAIDQATPEQACLHPNWSMGQKISVDSATLMNKGLEFIEACWLFDVEPSQIEVVIHPQSIIHSMVEYVDGSVLAQLGCPDMRTPIAHALAWPERIPSGVSSLDWFAMSALQFEPPNHRHFPALMIAIEAAQSGNGSATILNAANEVAVVLFLQRQIAFGDISRVLQAVMASAKGWEPASIADVLELDAYGRRLANDAVASVNHVL